MPGQRVWVKDHTANVGGKRKLALYYKGPAMVIEKHGSSEEGVTYKVSMPGGKETNVHHNHLKPVKLRERGDLVDQRAAPREQKKLPENRGHDDSSGGTMGHAIATPAGWQCHRSGYRPGGGLAP